MKKKKQAARELKVALVHDWLTGMRGGEKVLEVLCELYPHATLFTLLHNKGAMSPVIEGMDIRTSFIENLPFKEEKYRNYLPIMPRAIESFDFSGYDLILSSSHCVAKGAIPKSNALHICYCFTPMRYMWELYDEYFGKRRAGLLTRAAMSLVAPYLRRWDVRTARRVDYFVTSAKYVATRIDRYYNRSAEVIHAPVDSSFFRVCKRHKGYYLVVSALVPYKRVDLAIETFNRIGARLVIAGKGPDLQKLKSIAKPNIEFLGWQSDEDLRDLYANCRALIFPGVEDFGIVPLEAMASGKPVIAFGKGGALETVVDKGRDATGIFFSEQTAESLAEALKAFEKRRFHPEAIRRHAEKFSREIFKKKLHKWIEEKLERHFGG